MHVLIEWHEAQFIDGGQFVGSDLFLESQRLFFVVCLDQLADQRCSLPVFAKQQTFSRRVRNSQRASSKLSMVLTTGNFACRMLRSMARRSRPDNSNSAMRNR